MHAIKQIMIIASISLITVISQANHKTKESIDKRTSPVGQVTIAGTEDANENAQAAVTAEPRDGASLYNSMCIACHSTGLANAPKAGDTETWNKLLEAGMDSLVASAKIGKNVMPPMGNCLDCTDEELKSAIQYMVDL